MAANSITADNTLADDALELLDAANQIGGAILTMREEGPLFELVLVRLLERLRADTGAIFSYDGQRFANPTVSSPKRTPSPLPRLANLIERVLPQSGGNVQMIDGAYALEANDAGGEAVATLSEAGLQQLLIVPLVTRGAPMGAIALGNTRPAVFSPTALRVLHLTGQLLASGLRERRLQARLDAANRELATQSAWQGNDELIDSLTGLPTRDYFMGELERAVGEGVQTGGNVSLLRLEIDHFKAVTAAYGAEFANNVLSRVGQTILSSIRGRDLATRSTDDLFYVLLPQTPGIGAVVVAERLRDRLSAMSFEVVEGAWHLTASVGVSCLSSRVVSADELLAKSQRCLLQSKALGGNQVFFDWDEALEATGEK